MNIAVNVTAIQGPHRMRGVGAVVIHFINNLSAEARKDNHYIFITYADSDVKIEEILELDNLSYETRPIVTKAIPPLTFPGKLRLLERGLRFIGSLPTLFRGDPELVLEDVDVYLHTDQMQLMPRAARKVPSAFIAYDVIPYVLQWDYLPSYSTGRIKGWSRKAALRSHFNRLKYRQVLRTNSRLAKQALAISTKTKDDFTKYIGTKPEKQTVVLLGVPTEADRELPQPALQHYEASSWGYMQKPYKLHPDTPYILYTGGADSRRKLNDLVVAFNCLRAEGHDLKLLLVGDILQGPNNIPIVETQKALQTSSYLEDIVFMGFVTEETKYWLFKNALAFVYPSKYEGFGLPVLEAMTKGAPVICYKNAAVAEIGGTAALYANSADDIRKHVLDLMSYDQKQIQKIREKSIAHAKTFSWTKTANEIIAALQKIA